MNVFLTGAGGGIGKTIKKLLEDTNINVIAPSSKELDLTKDFKIEETVDAYIHCAGINVLSNHKDIQYETLQKTFDINTFSFVKLCDQLKFNDGSNIIAIGSLYSIMTRENRIQYSMSKHALLGAVKTIALEKSSNSIKVNMISPGFVDTELTRKNNDVERINKIESETPLGLVSPWQIANFCLYLIKENKYITGQNIIIDGGYSLKSI
jgi:3-oxoacyl-[acyl-carrier protein] reductase